MTMTIFIISLASVILGAAALSWYNKAGIGFLLGLFLGPIGVLFALLIRSSEGKKEDQRRHEEQMKALSDLSATKAMDHLERECPFCAELILKKAKVCKHCSRDVQALPSEGIEEGEEDVVLGSPRCLACGATYDPALYDSNAEKWFCAECKGEIRKSV